MKRVKIMLTAIGILAVVGGAVAFKAEKFGGMSYCTTTNVLATVCFLSTPNRTVVPGSSNFKYVRVPNGTACAGGFFCTQIGTGLVQ